MKKLSSKQATVLSEMRTAQLLQATIHANVTLEELTHVTTGWTYLVLKVVSWMYRRAMCSALMHIKRRREASREFWNQTFGEDVHD